MKAFACLFLYDFKCIINDFLCNTLFTVKHNVIDKLCYNNAVVDWVCKNFSFSNITFSWHIFFPPS